MRVHPVQRKAFLYVKLARGISFKDGFCEQAVYGHDRNLAAELQPPALSGNLFAWLEFASVHAVLGIALILLEGVLGIVFARHENSLSERGLEVLQIQAIGQSVLREHKKRIGVSV